MTVITRYRCEFCGTEYEEEDVCACCEERHVAPNEIVSQGYKRCRGTKQVNYPETIDIAFENGKVKTYYGSCLDFSRTREGEAQEEFKQVWRFALEHGYRPR